MVGRFQGRDIIDKPSCPFCGAFIERPGELSFRMPTELPLGRCNCGAVYACDVTGHNLGTAMIEALVFACGGDWDLAWDLQPEEDYLEKHVGHYDYETHLIIHGGIYSGRRIAGKLLFIRLHQDVREVTDQDTRRLIEKSASASEGMPRRSKGPRAFSKQEVETLVQDYDVERVMQLAERDHRIIRDLQRLLYSVDLLLRWKTAELLGKAAAVVARSDPGAVSKLLQGLFTSLRDTAASSWGSLDAIGEIISHKPEQFAGYTPELFPFLADRSLLKDVLRALEKIGEKRPDLIRRKAFHFIPLLRDPDPEVRGYAAMLLGSIGAGEAGDDLMALKADSNIMGIYREGKIEDVSVGRLAAEALEKM